MEAILIILGVILVIVLSAWGLRVFVRRVLKDDVVRLARWIVGLLVLQFILGMAANLFQKIPQTKPWLVFHELGPISVHTVNAVILLILAFYARVLVGKQKLPVAPVAIGGAAIAVAVLSGTIFVNFGQHDIWSFLMALAFIVALLEFAYVGFRRAGR